MKDFSILIGGKAGYGIDKAGLILGKILSRLGYCIYIYRDYPSLIRGGHTFSIIRASKNKIACHQNKVDFILALNQDTIELHKNRLKKDCLIIYDPGQIKSKSATVCGTPLSLDKIIKEENAPEVMRNSCIIGAFVKACGIAWDILDSVLRKEMAKEIDLNLKIAHRGYDAVSELMKIETLSQPGMPLLSGNEAIGLGLIKGGLTTYIAYPMTPSSPILHYLAALTEDFSLRVIHPESEIAVVLMALGFSYAGERAAVGTSGGGFCLMTEGVSLSATSELPVVFIVGQRPGPSTGLPTYSAQTELHFVLNSGQGEFVRFVVAPGDPEEAYYLSALSMNLAQKYQIPGFILSDKNMGEGLYSFDFDSIGETKEEKSPPWDGKTPYKRYLNTENGVSPVAFVPTKGAIIKINSYEHDESGITTEDPETTRLMQDKRLRKGKFLSEDLEQLDTVRTYAHRDAQVALLCWGSNKGVCIEIAQSLGLRVIQPLVLSPFPLKQFEVALNGVTKLIAVENNATGQLVRLINGFGFKVDARILKYDGRPFAFEELKEKVENLINERK